MNLEKSIRKINDLLQKNPNFFLILSNAINLDLNQNQLEISQNKFVFRIEQCQQLSKALALTFDIENKNEGNVCFANNKGLRSEFKDSFTPEDVFNCFYGGLNLEEEHSLVILNTLTFLLKKKDRVEIQKIFWQLVEMGEKIEK